MKYCFRFWTMVEALWICLCLFMLICVTTSFIFMAVLALHGIYAALICSAIPSAILVPCIISLLKDAKYWHEAWRENLATDKRIQRLLTEQNVCDFNLEPRID